MQDIAMDEMKIGFGVYVHIPFCAAKCLYCDFNSVSGADHLIPQYFDALLQELETQGSSKNREDGRATSVFIGGGTPSLPEAGYISALMRSLRTRYMLQENAEVTIESNPGTLNAEKLESYLSSGINRISIGLQAWQDDILAMLGRIHDGRCFVSNYMDARRTGFSNINVDLIFGIPGQTEDNWKETLETVAALAPEHISAYSLKIEEGTEFCRRIGSGALESPDEETDREMYHHAVDFLKKCGYVHYEISNFAMPGFECRHNMLYWKGMRYAGFGAGAHSFTGGRRYHNPCDIERYMRAVSEGSPLDEEIEQIGEEEAMSEYMMLGLRLVEGVDTGCFEKRFGIGFDSRFGTRTRSLVDRGLLERDGRMLRLTRTGLDLANAVFMEYLIDP